MDVPAHVFPYFFHDQRATIHALFLMQSYSVMAENGLKAGVDKICQRREQDEYRETNENGHFEQEPGSFTDETPRDADVARCQRRHIVLRVVLLDKIVSVVNDYRLEPPEIVEACRWFPIEWVGFGNSARVEGHCFFVDYVCVQRAVRELGQTEHENTTGHG